MLKFKNLPAAKIAIPKGQVEFQDRLLEKPEAIERLTKALDICEKYVPLRHALRTKEGLAESAYAELKDGEGKVKLIDLETAISEAIDNAIGEHLEGISAHLEQLGESSPGSRIGISIPDTAYTIEVAQETDTKVRVIPHLGPIFESLAKILISKMAEVEPQLEFDDETFEKRLYHLTFFSWKWIPNALKNYVNQIRMLKENWDAEADLTPYLRRFVDVAASGAIRTLEKRSNLFVPPFHQFTPRIYVSVELVYRLLLVKLSETIPELSMTLATTNPIIAPRLDSIDKLSRKLFDEDYSDLEKLQSTAEKMLQEEKEFEKALQKYWPNPQPPDPIAHAKHLVELNRRSLEHQCAASRFQTSLSLIKAEYEKSYGFVLEAKRDPDVTSFIDISRATYPCNRVFELCRSFERLFRELRALRAYNENIFEMHRRHFAQFFK
ncbi:hypothetical protein HY988_00410 [Candidatus Micrarchaeota archaeon]|nr:hypothetical protein [Candidatus Micrarchaeota archaeon]